MNGTNKALLDSNVIIYTSKQLFDFSKLVQHYNQFYVSIVTYIEVLGFNFSNSTEKLLIQNLFNNLTILELNFPIANTTIGYRINHKIKLPDAVILASAKNVNADLITNNISDFQNIDNSINILDLSNF